MNTVINEIEGLVGNTKLCKLKNERINWYVKIEGDNFTRSIKDRPAHYILKHAIQDGIIDGETTIVESSSGNFALALASMCKLLELNFIAVVDPNVNKNCKKILGMLCKEVVEVDEEDWTGGYLLNRIAKVKELCDYYENSYWPNQYENPNNYLSYYYTLAEEICESFNQLDYLFVSTSSCGTISGLSNRLKEKFPNLCVVAVDIEGSILFQDEPRKRFHTGIGASIKSPHLEHAYIDEIIHVSPLDIVKGTRELFVRHALFSGASSGAWFHAIHDFFMKERSWMKPNVLCLMADQGDAYIDTVYNDEWVSLLRDEIIEMEKV